MSKPTVDISGVITALITPFTEDGSAVDYTALEKIVKAQNDGYVDGVVPCGTTGESPTLSHEEQVAVIKFVCEKAKGCTRPEGSVKSSPLTVIAGTGSNSTAHAVELTQAAKDAGADACLLVNPYYNKPTQTGMFKHVQKVAEVGLPIVLYNIPGRCGVGMTPDTIAKCYNEIPMVVAVKEATGSLDQSSEIASLCPIAILSGDDSLTLPLMSVGAKGVISVCSNVSSLTVHNIVDPASKGDFAKAREAHVGSFSLFKTFFCETNPQPIKYAMHLAGYGTGTMRAPMCEISEDNKEKVKKAMQEHKILA